MNGLVPLRADFELLRQFMVGSPRQFLVWQGETFCARAHPADLAGKNPALNPCEGCPHFQAGCEIGEERAVEAAYKSKDDNSVSGIVPHSRRGIGMEERPFLVLRFKLGQSHATLPRSLWDNPHADKAMDERNLHFLLTNPRTTLFHTIKGQLRFYGTAEAFRDSPYAAHLDVFDEFEPSHHPISMDKSAIEPRVCTLVTEEPRWREVFQGSPKVISREIRFAELPAQFPRYIYKRGARTFCYLEGELDKAEYANQCAKCALASTCRPQVDHLKNVAGDWHAINASGFFGAEFSECQDPYRRKELRGKSKIGGLASIYGGTKYTLARSLGMPEEEAHTALVRFFSTLVVARKYMESIKAGLQTHGKVWNRFGRERDMRRWSHSQAMMPVIAGHDANRKPILATDRLKQPDGTVIEVPRMVPDRKQRFKDLGYAERTGLNYPIQGTAGELMKMAMIEIDSLIKRHDWNPLLGAAMPPTMPVGDKAYLAIKFALLSTIHDELLDLIRDGMVEDIIPLAYTAMQLEHVMKALGAGFSLELDVELDGYRSWTAGTSIPTAKIYLLNRLRAEPADGPRPPNAAIVALEDCNPEFVAGCNAYVEVEGEPRDFHVAVQGNGKLYIPPHGMFSRAHIQRVAQATSVPLRFAAM